MNENTKKTPFIIIFIIGMVVGFVLCCALLCYGNSDNTQSTISVIKEQQSVVNTEIGNASNGIGNATNSVKQASNGINGVQERLIQSERIANDNSNRISNLTKIARECKSIAEENRAIYKSVGEANKTNTP